MGYPFHKATEITTAKCIRCGIRIRADTVHYRYFRDTKAINSGYYGVLTEDTITNRMIETFCSIQCSKKYTDRRVTVFEALFEEYLVPLCDEGLHPMTKVNSVIHPRSGKVHCRQCKVASAQRGWQHRLQKVS